jgi:hypothetical protein
MLRRDHVAAPRRFSHAWAAECSCSWRGPDHGLGDRGRELAASDAERHLEDPEPRRQFRDWEPGDKWGDDY